MNINLEQRFATYDLTLLKNPNSKLDAKIESLTVIKMLEN